MLDSDERAPARPRTGTRRPPQRRGFAAAVRGFVARYGWRAYALPVLVVVTIVALSTATRERPKPAPSKHAGVTPPHSVVPTASGDIALKSDPAGPVPSGVAVAAALPPGPAYTEKGAGTFRVIPGTTPVFGSGPLKRFTIDIENGITGIDANEFAATALKALQDPRSWAAHGISLQRVASGGDFHISLTSSMTVRTLCGYDIKIETSCYARAGSSSAADTNRVAINLARWVRGDMNYVGDLDAYRLYLINHESGHALGHQHAHACLPGGLAPVMMQQTIGLRSAATGEMCGANPWPYPTGIAGAPGHEEPDTPQNSEIVLTRD